MSFQYVPRKTVDVPEIKYKDSIVLPGRKTAVIVVDMQNDFVKPGGNLVVPPAEDTVPNIQKLLKSARNSGARIAYTQDTHYEGDREWEIWPQHCRESLWGWQIIEELKPEQEDLICRKNRYDGFYGTWLEHYLSCIWKVEHLVIAGTVSNICVAHTAASAGLRWFHLVMAADCVSALTEFDQALTLRQISTLYYGEVVKSVMDISFGVNLIA